MCHCTPNKRTPVCENCPEEMKDTRQQLKSCAHCGGEPEKIDTAKNPKNLTESSAWKEMMEKYLPDGKLLQKHEEALEATKWNDFTGEREEDHTTRLKAVELGYKLKRKLGPEVIQQFNSENMEIEFIGNESNTS